MSFGVNLIASVRGDAGLGVTARNIARALLRHEVALSIVDVPHPWGGALAVPDLEPHLAHSAADARHAVNLHVLQLPMYLAIERFVPGLQVAGRMNVASMWWEATALPPAWVEPLSRFDAVLAGSEFLAQVLSNELVLTPVIHAPHPLEIPKEVRPSRARFGLPEDATVFGLSFDPVSDPARKNPVGAIRAFRHAFDQGSDGACLAVRMNHARESAAAGVLDALRAAAGGDPRIRFLVDAMPYEDVLAFYASCDAYVSLHRGEGLGLGMLESMALGRPVIATAWSGNTSFMDWRSGCPVRYRLVRVAGGLFFTHPTFVGRHARWAEPVLEDAVAWMRRLHADPEGRRALGRRAADAFEEHQRRARGRGWIDEIEAVWRARHLPPIHQGKLSAAGI